MWKTSIKVLLFCSILRTLFTFENVADIKFILGIGLPWKIWKKLYSPKSSLGGEFQNEVLIKSCNELNEIFSSYQPILFKKCIKEGLGLNDFLFFEDHVQNLFPPCEGELLRNFQFEAFNGEHKDIIEDVPCANSTLNEKVTSFKLHELSENQSDSTSYFEVHTFMMASEERRHLNKALFEGKRLVHNVDNFISKMVAPVLTYFFHAGRSAVYYLHAHMDHFLSFCLTERKTWELVNPLYLDEFDSVWSGNARVMLKEKKNVPKIIVQQEKGDILYIPPWWIHETKVRKLKKNIGFNIHFGVRGQVVFEVVNVINNIFGDASFFYSKVK